MSRGRGRALRRRGAGPGAEEAAVVPDGRRGRDGSVGGRRRRTAAWVAAALVLTAAGAAAPVEAMASAAGAAGTTPVVGGDAGTFSSTLFPATNLYPTGTGPQRAVVRDCGQSTDVPGGKTLWLFCDTALYDGIAGSPPDLSATTSFVPSGTAALAPTRARPTPTRPVELHEAEYPARPRPFIRSSGRHGADRRPIACAGGRSSLAWTSGMVTLPGSSTVVTFYTDFCPDAAGGFPRYDAGVAELDLPATPADDFSQGDDLQVARQYDSVQINPHPGTSEGWGYGTGAVVDGAYIYLYQSASDPLDPAAGHLSVARVPWAGRQYRSAANYRYYTGSGSNPWSASPAAAVDILPDRGWPADGVSVEWYPELDRYVMVHTDTPYGAAAGMSLRTATEPWGPWSAPVDVAPDAGSSFANPAGGCAAPNRCRAFNLHPSLSGSGGPLHVGYVRAEDFATTTGRRVTFDGDAGFRVRLTSVPTSVLPRAPVPAGITRPTAARAVTATPGDGRATVSWAAPTSTGGSQVTGYVVTPYVGTTPQAPITFGSTATTQVVPGLANGVAHSFTVAARNVAGTGPASTRSSTTTPTGPPPNPMSVRAVPGDGRVSLSWSAPARNGGSPITGYRVTPRVDGVAGTPRVLTSTSTSAVITGLGNGTSVTFTVAATSALGTGEDSAPSDAVTPRGVPTAPTAVAVIAGDRKVNLSWKAPASDNGAPITGYRITPYAGATALPTRSVGTLPATEVTGLTNGTTLTFRVAAVNAAGVGAPSAPSAPVTPRTVPQAPTGVSAEAGNRQVDLSWTAPPDGGWPIIGYKVVPYVRGVAQPALVLPTTATSRTFPYLENGVPHRFEVSAYSAAGPGPGTLSAVVTPRGPPGAPSGVVAIPGDARVTLTWDRPVSDGGSAITAYRITPFANYAPQAPITVGGTSTTTVITGLTNGVLYNFSVVAVNVAGASWASPASAGVRPDPALAATPAPFPSWSAMVDALYRDVVGRAPTSAERTSAAGGLAAGTTTPGRVVAALRRSSDHVGVVDPVARLYRAYFLRPPDPSGLAYWTGRRRAGWSLFRISAFFAGSVEFSQRYGTLSNPAFMDLIYTQVLERPPDAAGRAFWIGELDSRRRDRGEVMVGFSEAQEYRARYQSTVDATVAFPLLLGRASTAAETDQWRSRAQAGTAHEALLDELLRSAEYRDRNQGP